MIARTRAAGWWGLLALMKYLEQEWRVLDFLFHPTTAAPFSSIPHKQHALSLFHWEAIAKSHLCCYDHQLVMLSHPPNVYYQTCYFLHFLFSVHVLFSFYCSSFQPLALWLLLHHQSSKWCFSHLHLQFQILLYWINWEKQKVLSLVNIINNASMIFLDNTSGEKHRT